MNEFDPRLTPARPDLAARHLDGRINAARFVDGVVHEVIAPQAPMRREPTHEVALDTELLRGERVTVYESTGEGWSWGQLQSDGYVGWLPSEALIRPGPEATHRVAALRTLVFPGPSIKQTPLAFLSFGCRLAITRVDGELAVDSRGGFLPACHLAAVASVEADFVAVAERFVGVPYLWGGKTSLGLDCSALVQVSLTATGVACPRDSDMQQDALGRAVDVGSDFAGLRRGDLLFWEGHVAVARDRDTIVHANAHHMAVAIEPVADAVRRIAAAGYAPPCVRRLS
jgi:cell wall-associated NlpC family hydrolase